MDRGRDFMRTWMHCVWTQMVVGKDGGKEIRKKNSLGSSMVINVVLASGQMLISNAMWLRKHAQSFSSQLVTPPLIRIGLIGHQYHTSMDKVSFVLLGTNHH